MKYEEWTQYHCLLHLAVWWWCLLQVLLLSKLNYFTAWINSSAWYGHIISTNRQVNVQTSNRFPGTKGAIIRFCMHGLWIGCFMISCSTSYAVHVFGHFNSFLDSTFWLKKEKETSNKIQHSIFLSSFFNVVTPLFRFLHLLNFWQIRKPRLYRLLYGRQETNPSISFVAWFTFTRYHIWQLMELIRNDLPISRYSHVSLFYIGNSLITSMWTDGQ